MALEVVVLAAGAGTRMRSRTPKVLHPLAGRPLLAHVLDTAFRLEPDQCHVVVGHPANEVKAHFQDESRISWVLQEPRLGSGDAAAQALPAVADDATVLVLLGDVPLVRAETLSRCVAAAGDGIALVTIDLPDPSGLGRILRRDSRITGIVEDADATAEQRAITEINTGILAAPKAVLGTLLETLDRNNNQGEYYLTDIVGKAEARGIAVTGIDGHVPEEVMGVNDRVQLAHLERYYQRGLADELMRQGVAVMDPSRLDIRGRLKAGRDCVVDVDVVFEGDVILGEGVQVGPGCVIRNSTLGDAVEVQPMSCIDGAVIAAGCRIGPYARLRPGTELAESVHIGNFVETKKASLGAGAKANHLAYLGDAAVGAGTNVGAGAITCNYDGVDKHRTEIGENVFIGTNATLVAPLTIDDEAYVGAGSTITKTVEREDLAIGRGRQRNIQGWTPPAKRRTDEGR
ncbi:MAG: bifunctional UDP-N-acetylglucosamine diphosphorylase/glucosamine-1-phosphate N-acetyltransferase GlmU [Gammaproteobacteria bacterium]|nr:bifunctional UDP-N-acetylglucosamine diphosphorylase/glucosamine-1-phosphate N-acetyltransferase GlmU [Gammaproteobacteria bacterium]